MASKRRQIERVALAGDDVAPIVARMVQLAAAGDGWINLVPRISDDDERPTSLNFFTLFGGSGSGVTMCTWIPGSYDHGEPSPARLGITHITGHRVGAKLQSLGVPIPATWFVEQDHPRRGLVVRIPYDEPEEGALVWALRVVEVLSAPRPIISWRADVYLPTAS